MRKVIVLMLSAAALAAPTLAIAETPAKAQARLERALAGRVAGEPVDCIDLHRIRSTQIIDRTAILYDMGGGTIYLNRPENGASTLDRWDTLVTDTHSHRLCSIDVVRLYDTSARMHTGFVFLGEFVPYRKPRA